MIKAHVHFEVFMRDPYLWVNGRKIIHLAKYPEDNDSIEFSGSIGELLTTVTDTVLRDDGAVNLWVNYEVSDFESLKSYCDRWLPESGFCVEQGPQYEAFLNGQEA